MANKAELRQFIMTYFSDDELNALCYDYFPEVLNNFTTGMTKSQKVIDLLSYCERRDLMENLHAALAILRSESYQELIASLPTLKPKERVEGRDPNRIFLSHANQDSGFAQQLADDLRRQGYGVWIAPGSIEPGEKWVDAIERGLETSGIFLLVMTAHAANSRWVKDESSYAIDLENKGEIRLITLDVAEGKLPPMWRVRQHIPFRQDYDDGLRQLLTTLRTKKLAAVPPLADLSPPPSSRIPSWLPVLVGLAFVLLAVVLTRSMLISVKDEEPPQVGMAVASVETATNHPTAFVTVIHSPTPRPDAPATVTPQPTVMPSPTIKPTRIDPTLVASNPPITIAVTVVAPTSPPPTTTLPPTSTSTPTPTDTLTPTDTPTPTHTPSPTDTPPSLESIGGPASSSSFVPVYDDANAVYVEVPEGWDEVDGSNWVYADGTVRGSKLIAAPNIDRFIDTYTTPGVQIHASTDLGGRDIGGLVNLYDFRTHCVYDGRFDFITPIFIGVYDQYSNCAGEGSVIIVLGAEPADKSFATIVLVQAVTNADLDALDHIWNTFNVVGTLPGQ